MSERWNPDIARSHLAALASSGESVRAYARRRGLSSQRLIYWRNLLAAQQPASPRFVEVSFARPLGVDEPIILTCGAGRTLRFPPSCPPDRIAAVLQALDARC